MYSAILALNLLPLAAWAAPQASPGVPNNVFELYAYGDGFGGLSVFNWNGEHEALVSTCKDNADTSLGLAYLGDASLANDTEAAQVICKSSLFLGSCLQRYID